MRALPDALARWPEIAARLAGHPLALFLDYDGTLSPIALRPELATLPAATRDILARLAERMPVAVLSGRGREDVAALVGLPEIVYAGSHGYDIEGPGVRHEVGEGIPATIAAVARRLGAELAGIPGILVEPKRFSVAVHHRLVADEFLPRIEAAVDRALAEHSDLKKAFGKKVFELRPAMDWDKGKALSWLLDRLAAGGPPPLPIYLGDDDTDEDAFREVAGRGIGILVADEPRDTAAEYGVRNTEEAREWLARLVGFDPATGAV
ncbi:MAG TPA: trehalose-phosphatase [Thermoanaerobaculia bacterium]